MRKILLPLAAALALSTTSCAMLDNMGLGQAPAPLQQTVIDEKGLIYAWQSYDTLLTLVDKALDAKMLVPGSPRAMAIRAHLIRVNIALNAASAARRAGSTTQYEAAFTEATEAMRLAQLAIKG